MSNSLVIGGGLAALTLAGFIAAAHSHHGGQKPPIDQVMRHYSHGGPLGALAAGGLMRLTAFHTTNPAAMATAAGVGAVLGSFVGDRNWAKHAPLGLIGTVAGITGAAAVGTRVLSDRYIDKGYLALRSFLSKNEALEEGFVKALTSIKSLHPIVDSIVSRAGLKGLLTVAAIPIAHQMVQRTITRKYRHAQAFLHSSILGPLSPHPEEIQTSGPRYLPGTKVNGGTLTMQGDVYDHTDPIDLNRL